MIQPLDIEVFDNKKIILHDIDEKNKNIVNNKKTEEKQREIDKLNEEFNDIVRKEKLEIRL